MIFFTFKIEKHCNLYVVTTRILCKILINITQFIVYGYSYKRYFDSLISCY